MGAHYRCWWWWKVRPLPSGGRRGSLLPADGRLRRLVRRGDDHVPVALRSRRRLLSPSPLQQYYHTILVMIMSGKKTLVIQCTCPCNRSRESPAEREKEGGAANVAVPPDRRARHQRGGWSRQILAADDGGDGEAHPARGIDCAASFVHLHPSAVLPVEHCDAKVQSQRSFGCGNHFGNREEVRS